METQQAQGKLDIDMRSTMRRWCRWGCGLMTRATLSDEGLTARSTRAQDEVRVL